MIENGPAAAALATSAAPSAATSAAARRTLLILTAVYGINTVDRQILAILIQPIKLELHLSDTQLGVLTGLAFALFYAALGLPLARLAERAGRRRVIAGSVGLFALATTLSAAAASFWQLFAARMLVGIGEAGTTPASLSIIADLYPESRRTGAMAVFTSGSLVAFLAGFMIAGQVATRYGWRAALLVSGMPGLLLAFAVARFVIDRLPRPAAVEPAGAALARLARDRSFQLLCLAGSLPLFTSAAVAAWLPAYVQRRFGVDAATLGLIFGLGVGIGGTAVTLASGWLADRLHARSTTGPLAMVAIGILLCSAAFAGALDAASLRGLVLWLVPALGLVTIWQAPLLARVQLLARPGERASVVALYMLVTSLIGLALGPTVTGALSEHFGQGSAGGLRDALRLALLGNVASAGLLALLIGRSRLRPPPRPRSSR